MRDETRHAVDRKVAIAKASRHHKLDQRAERKAALEEARAATHALLALYNERQSAANNP